MSLTKPIMINIFILYMTNLTTTVKVLFFVGINFRGLFKNYKFMDSYIRGFCVCTENKICGFYIFNIISFIG